MIDTRLSEVFDKRGLAGALDLQLQTLNLHRDNSSVEKNGGKKETGKRGQQARRAGRKE